MSENRFEVQENIIEIWGREVYNKPRASDKVKKETESYDVTEKGSSKGSQTWLNIGTPWGIFQSPGAQVKLRVN